MPRTRGKGRAVHVHEEPGWVGLYGGIETGGTTVACAIGSGPDHIMAEMRFPTAAPAETIDRVIGFFRAQSATQPVQAIGIGSFGPLDLDLASPTYGFITTTPKEGWQQTDLCGPIRSALQVPVTLDTDVNAAALAEYRWADTSDTDPLLYVTVGTGIGLGAIVHGRPLHGLVHPEAGHLLVPHDLDADPFQGSCPFHGDCWEGLASGAAMKERWGRPAETLPLDHPAWELEARYLGLGIADLIYCFAPRRVVVGGGIMQRRGLLERVRVQVQSVIGGYLKSAAPGGALEQLIVPPRLGQRSGVLGALALAANG